MEAASDPRPGSNAIVIQCFGSKGCSKFKTGECRANAFGIRDLTQPVYLSINMSIYTVTKLHMAGTASSPTGLCDKGGNISQHLTSSLGFAA